MKLTVSSIKLPFDHTDKDLCRACAKQLHIKPQDIRDLSIKHRSLDARNKADIKYVYTCTVETPNGDSILSDRRIKNVSAAGHTAYRIPEKTYSGRPVIIGAGPAGLFCAYALVEAGLSPILLERGADVDSRQEDVSRFWETGQLRPDSNVQFGEGGAGAFSDGKLNTLIKDRDGRCEFVLRTFVRFGAEESILYDAKPHIGTDVLTAVVKNMREYLREHGADIRFNTKAEGFSVSGGCINGVYTESDEIPADRVVLAIGHSARDTFLQLDSMGINMSPKSFAVGLRVEHPQNFIDISQYGRLHGEKLPTAAYKVTAQTSYGRGVYSFCMCPGGYVVNASSEEHMLAVNGMSYSGRSGSNANSAIIVTVGPEDYPDRGTLSGMYFQRELEYKAYDIGSGRIPVQRFGDFRENVSRTAHPCTVHDEAVWQDFRPQNKGSFNWAPVHEILPSELNMSILEGMEEFGRKIRGFDDPYAIFSGVESRTSSPVRIWRDDNGCSPSLYGLYPCGEGAGYAGGITSAAMDGVLTAEKILLSDR